MANISVQTFNSVFTHSDLKEIDAILEKGSCAFFVYNFFIQTKDLQILRRNIWERKIDI